jgi:hypothetical protein
MDSHNDTLVTALIETIASWTDADKDRLASMLGAHCWPGGILDRTDPGAAGSMRQSGPDGPIPPVPGCSCIRGRCTICN